MQNRIDADAVDEDSHIDLKRLGTFSEPSMFEMVRKTLRDLKRESAGNKVDAGFLLIVIGGNFSDMHCPNSQLSQSVKYVREHTCAKDTLLIVTSLCNKIHTYIKKEIDPKRGYHRKLSEDIKYPILADGNFLLLLFLYA